MTLLILPGWCAVATPMVLVTEDVAPLNMISPDNGEVTGIATELIKKAFLEAKIPYSIKLYSWARAYDTALHDSNSCVYSTGRSEERNPVFKWVGPIVKDYWVLFGRADSPKLSSLEEVRNKVIGGHFRGASTDFLKQQGFRVEEVDDFHSNFKSLVAHRIDYWVSGDIGGRYTIAQNSAYQGIVPVLRIKEVDLYLACNGSVPDETVATLNRIIRRMTDDGTAEAIIKKFIVKKFDTSEATRDLPGEAKSSTP